MDREEILGMSVSALRAKLTEVGLSTQGLKEELQNRLLERYKLDISEQDEGRDYVGDEVEGGAHASGSPEVNYDVEAHRNSGGRSLYTLRDVEDSLSQFSGSGTPDINQWLEEFENMAAILKWSSLEMFVYGKQLLVGAAKMFIKGKRGIGDWHALRAALKDEFEERCSTAEIIRQIRNRRLNRNETLVEYLYCIMEIASKIHLDENSVIEYFIEGIPDSRLNKTVLYQASNIRELKTQLKVYEKTRRPPQSSYRGKEVSTVEKKDSSRELKPTVSPRCFKYGDKSHIARDCTKQHKCFKCQRFGHKSFDCPDRKFEKRPDRTQGSQANMVQKGPGLIFKDVVMRGKPFSALIDTGCDICLMRCDTLFVLGEIDFVAERVELHGIGNSTITTMGRFDERIYIDEVDFEITFYVVGERDINHSIMLGNSLLRKADVTINNGEVTLKKPVEKNLFLEKFSEIC